MRMSQLFVQTLREAPTEAGLPGYQLLLRGGFIRPLAPGSYSFLPLGVQVRRKIEVIIRQAMHAVGGQEVLLPRVQPADLWLEAGQDKLMGEDISARRGTVRFRDRGQRELVLGTSHEEAILTFARHVLQSYRQLPMMLYQVWQPFRDESRTGGGLFGARETLVADGYSLHADGADLDRFYPRVQGALGDVFAQCDLKVVHAAAALDESGAPTAHKLIWPFGAGEEAVVACDACGYMADQAIARAGKTPPPAEAMLPMEDVETPNCKTIADLAQFLDIPESRTAKALFLVAYIKGQGDQFIFAVVRGDTDLNEAKLKRVLKAETVGPATEAEIRSVGAEPGYGSPVGLMGVTIVVDDLIPQSPNLVAGANRPGYHTLNVNYGRDYQASVVADITLAQEGDPCPECGTPLRVKQGINIATMAKVGDSYSQMLNATYLDQEGQAQPMIMGRYRLYADRLLAAIAEVHRDEHGLVWPVSVAPYAVYLMTLGKRSETVDAAADRLCADLTDADIDVLYDDRDERAGVKFNDADLLGVPLRVVVGERGLKNGTLELKQRHAEEIEAIPIENLLSRMKDML
jgi:prolyl-tRNA synthetase